MLIVGLWTCFNLIVAGVALGVVAERREPDRFPRLAIARRGHLTLGETTLPVAIDSVSAGGCAIRLERGPSVLDTAILGTSARLAVEPLGGQAPRAPLDLTLVHRTPVDGAIALGFGFVGMRPDTYMSLADLMYGDPGAMTRFLAKRRGHRNLVRGTLRFIAWGLREPFRAASYARKRLPEAAEPALAPAIARPADTIMIGGSDLVAIPMAGEAMTHAVSITPVDATVATALANEAYIDREQTIEIVEAPSSADLANTTTVIPFTSVAQATTKTEPRVAAPKADILSDLFERTTARAGLTVDAHDTTTLDDAETKRANEIEPAEWLRALLAIAAREAAPAIEGEWPDVGSSVAA
jgi:hypothetical protein